MYPPVAYPSKVLAKDFVMNGQRIPKGKNSTPYHTVLYKCLGSWVLTPFQVTIKQNHLYIAFIVRWQCYFRYIGRSKVDKLMLC